MTTKIMIFNTPNYKYRERESETTPGWVMTVLLTIVKMATVLLDEWNILVQWMWTFVFANETFCR